MITLFHPLLFDFSYLTRTKLLFDLPVSKEGCLSHVVSITYGEVSETSYVFSICCHLGGIQHIIKQPWFKTSTMLLFAAVFNSIIALCSKS